MNRDPRRLFSPAERAHIAARQQHACSVCEQDLPESFHVHHITPWADGGRTHPDNGIAICPECHIKAPIKPLPQFEPYPWQSEALPVVLANLRGGEFATLNAAPGAGKTLFTGWVYRNLAVTGDRARLVVFVPNANLRSQHADELASVGIHLDTSSATERRDRDGVVLTYHVLSDPVAVQQIVEDADTTPTLFVLDEVHHLAIARGGDAGGWAVNIARIVGTVDRPEHPVLNLSGTLFRSDPAEQISTIKYTKVGNQVETVADYSIPAGQLIASGQLRHIKVLGYDADMTVHAVDVANSAHTGANTIRAVDLDGNAKMRPGVLSELVRNPRFLTGVLQETVSRLGHASVALKGAPVKGLVVADGVDHAEQIYAELANAIGHRHAFMAHGQMGTSVAEDAIRRFRLSTGQAVMVAVQMVTEGFDVPDVCVLTYLRTWRAPLFINQMVGRAMRVTRRERELGTLLPATILVPNETEVKSAFADVLVGAMQVLAIPPAPCDRCGREICTCPPRPKIRPDTVCQRCHQPWRFCTCPCNNCGLSPYTGCRCRPKWRAGCSRCGQRVCVCPPATTVDVTSDPQLAHVNVDGRDVDLHIIEATRESLRDDGVPEVWIESAVSALQQTMNRDPMAFLSYLRENRSDDSDD